MDLPSPDRIRDDLKGLIKGQLQFDELSRTLYSTDASLFQIVPCGVVCPQDESDIQTLVRYAGEHQLALIARGAGTGLAGEALGTGLIVDLSKHFRHILEIGADTVRVQPGVVLRELNRRLAEVGRRFAPDPTQQERTVGGVLASNASGPRVLRHGYTRDHVESLRVVLDSGDSVEIGRHSRCPSPEAVARVELPELTTDNRQLTTAENRLEDIVSSLATLLTQHDALIRSCQPRTPFNRCGYHLPGVLQGEEVILPRLLVGSEGTLGLFTEAVLRTIPVPAGRAVVLLGFARLDSALRAAQLALPTGPAACELIDRRLLRLARGNDAKIASLIPAATETVLLIEYEADSTDQARQQAADLARRFHRQDRLAHLALVAAIPEEIERFWQIRESALPSLYGLRGSSQPVAFLEDVGVPVEALADYLHKVQEVLRRHETTASFLVHAGSGQVEMRPFLDPQRADEVVRMWALAEDVYALVLDLGGTISSQHGVGLARTPWLSKQYGPLYPVFRDVKAIFDPRYLFNPGKIVGPTPAPTLWPLRATLHSAVVSCQLSVVGSEGTSLTTDNRQLTTALHWAEEEVLRETVSCNGCGQCRTEAPQQRMCPIFRGDPDELATPRAKANLMRHLLDPRTDPRALSSPEVRQVADLCVNCKMCASECPAHVNIPKLMLEAKAANVAEHGLDRNEWTLARTELFAALGSAFAPVANALLGNRVARWLLERLLGISRQRRLPAFASRTFLRRARHRGWSQKPRSGRPRVAYFVDIFANYNDPTIGEAVVAVLHHNGVEVYVPPEQVGSGMAALAQGDVETARETLQQNLRILGDLAREGYPILCSEPTAALMFRQDAHYLLDDLDVQQVAGQTVEFTSFLWDLHQQGRLRTEFDRLDLSLGHHVPCHLKALGSPQGGGAPQAGPALLSLIPGLRVHTIDRGCSGMAGTFGLRADSYALSLSAGRSMLQELKQPWALLGSTECSTCRLQMEDGAGKRTLHPAQYLALPTV